MVYEDMRVVDLKAELKQRGLLVSGLKAVLVQRLQEHDRKKEMLRGLAKPGSTSHQHQPTPRKGEGNVQAKADGVSKGGPAASSGKGAKEDEGSSLSTEKIGAAKAVAPVASAAKTAATLAARDRAQNNSAAAAAAATDPKVESPLTDNQARQVPTASAAVGTKPVSGVAETAEKVTAVTSNNHGDPATADGNPVMASSPSGTGGGSAGPARTGAGAGATSGETLEEDRNSRVQIMLTQGAGLIGFAISAACISVGDGLTADNLVTLHVALIGLFIAAVSANRRPTGSMALAARALATLVVAVVATNALQQAQRRPPRPREASVEGAGGVEGEGMAALAALVSEKVKVMTGSSCEPVVGGVGGDAAGVGDATCAAGDGQGAESASAFASMLAWVGAARSVMASEGWRTVRFGMIEFWGWASVAGYVTLVEALPVMLRPLHTMFRQLERVHNVLLSLTSLAMLVGIVRSCITSGKTASVHAMLCGAFDEEDPVFEVTSKVFFWSKAWEWFDTALLVAKGKPVSWLQYTHHGSTAILTALNMVPTRNAMWSVVCSLNSFVHAWMYAYYALPRFRLLRRLKVWLTWAQMLQHMTVLVSATYVLYMRHAGVECHNNTTPILAGLGLYLMYLVFFAIFYCQTYLRRGKNIKAE